jgi:hypothetical protein
MSKYLAAFLLTGTIAVSGCNNETMELIGQKKYIGNDGQLACTYRDNNLIMVVDLERSINPTNKKEVLEEYETRCAHVRDSSQ